MMKIHYLTLVIDYIHPIIENKNQLNPRELNLHRITLSKKKDIIPIIDRCSFLLFFR